jgi:hypothetical protein
MALNTDMLLLAAIDAVVGNNVIGISPLTAAMMLAPVVLGKLKMLFVASPDMIDEADILFGLRIV